MLRGGWFEGCSACRVIKLLVSSIAIVTTVAFYSLSETVWWGKWRTAISIEPPLVFWNARLDGTREAVPRRPKGNPCGTGILSDATLETLSKDLPINPHACKCEKIENTGGTFPICCRRYHATLLRYVVNTLPKYHLTFWLDFGTLLGAVREGGFMLHDSDIDIALLIATVEDARNLDRFLKRATLDGFGPNSWYPQEKKMNEKSRERIVEYLMKKHGSIADILTFTTFKPDPGFVDRYDAAAAVFMHKHDATVSGVASDVSEPTTKPATKTVPSADKKETASNEFAPRLFLLSVPSRFNKISSIFF